LQREAPPASAFRHPDSFPGLGGIFTAIQFPYDSNRIQGNATLNTLKEIATFLKKHKKTYLFIEGHCDERGAEAYNLALGTRRSHAVRDFLIERGVDAKQLFTVSYGKEKPIDLRHEEEAWSKNRRAEFKIYQR